MSLSWNNVNSCDKPLGSEDSGTIEITNKSVCSRASSCCIHFNEHQKSQAGTPGQVFWWTQKWLDRKTETVARETQDLLMSNACPKFPATVWMDSTEHLNPKAIHTPVYFQYAFSPHIGPSPHILPILSNLILYHFHLHKLQKSPRGST